MSEAAAESTEPAAGASRFPRTGPRSAPDRDRGPGEHAVRALFQPTSPDIGPRGPEVRSPDLPLPGPDPQLAITLSELRRQVAFQSAQLERAMEEVGTLTRRLDASRARATAAENAVARERALRGRQASDGARRLGELERTVAQLSAQLRVRRDAIAAPHREHAALLQRRIAARELMDERVAGVISAARQAIAEVRAELASGAGRIASLQAALARERERRTAVERQLADMAACEQRGSGERRRRLGAGPTAAGIGQPTLAGSASAHPGDTDFADRADVATACRRLEQELAARDALEVQAARLIGRLHREFGTEG